MDLRRRQRFFLIMFASLLLPMAVAAQLKRASAAAQQFIDGPPIQPGHALIAWLVEHAVPPLGSTAPRKKIQLPVVVRFANASPRTISLAYIGTSNTLLKGSPFLALDTTGLGSDLRSQLATRCPTPQPWCAVWLEGYFGELTPGAAAASAQDGWPFAVLKVLDRIDSTLANTNVRMRVAP